jgi:hypothetical protein
MPHRDAQAPVQYIGVRKCIPAKGVEQKLCQMVFSREEWLQEEEMRVGAE